MPFIMPLWLGKLIVAIRLLSQIYLPFLLLAVVAVVIFLLVGRDRYRRRLTLSPGAETLALRTLRENGKISATEAELLQSKLNSLPESSESSPLPDLSLRLAATFSLTFGWYSILVALLVFAAFAAIAIWSGLQPGAFQFQQPDIDAVRVILTMLTLFGSVGMILYARRLTRGDLPAQNGVICSWILVLPAVGSTVCNTLSSIVFSIAAFGMAAWCFWTLLLRPNASRAIAFNASEMPLGTKISVVFGALLVLGFGIAAGILSPQKSDIPVVTQLARSKGASEIHPYLEHLFLLPHPGDELARELAEQLAASLQAEKIPCSVADAPLHFDTDREMVLWIASGHVAEMQENFITIPGIPQKKTRSPMAGCVGFQVETIYPTNESFGDFFKGLVLPSMAQSFSGDVILLHESSPRQMAAAAAEKLHAELLPILSNVRSEKNIRLPKIPFDNPFPEPLPGCRLLATARGVEFETLEFYSFDAREEEEHDRDFAAQQLAPRGYRRDDSQFDVRFSLDDTDRPFKYHAQFWIHFPWGNTPLKLPMRTLLIPVRRVDRADDPQFIRNFFQSDPAGFALCAGWRHLDGEERLTAMRDFFAAPHSIAERLRVLQMTYFKNSPEEELSIVRQEYRKLIADIAAQQNSPEFISHVTSLLHSFRNPLWRELRPELEAALGESWRKIVIPRPKPGEKSAEGEVKLPAENVWEKQLMLQFEFEDERLQELFYGIGVLPGTQKGTWQMLSSNLKNNSCSASQIGQSGFEVCFQRDLPSTPPPCRLRACMFSPYENKSLPRPSLYGDDPRVILQAFFEVDPENSCFVVKYKLNAEKLDEFEQISD